MSRTRTHNPVKRRLTAILRVRRGFTLIEALVASALLGIVTLAVITAVASAQTLTFEGQKQILAVMAADDLMTELMTLPYADLKAKNGLDQPVGQMTTLGGTPYPSSCWAIGRSVQATEEIIPCDGLDVQIKGVRVIVSTRDEFRILASIVSFVPEPAQ